MSIELFKEWLLRFYPAPIAVNWQERLRACCGALIGIAIAGFITHRLFPSSVTELPWLIAPMGASAVLLFAVPASPLAQPWSILGGNIIAALVGVTCAKWFDITLLAAAVAIALAIAAMFALRCIHPPAGAVALTAVLGGSSVHAAGYHFVLMPVAINSALLLGAAMIYHALTRHSYPHVAHKTAPTTKQSAQLGFTSGDLDLALKNYNEILDINRDDLETLLHEAEANAYRRRFGETTCADVMTTPVVTVAFGDSLEDAWSLLIKHGIKALPVIDKSKRVVGIITQADFLKHTGVHSHKTLAVRLAAFVQRVRTVHADKPDVVGQIMTRRVLIASAHKSVIDLVPLFAEAGHHHIPIVDDDLRLVGMVTQSDLILALYNKRLREATAIAL
ncbi:MAG: domain containing rane protein [Verrucomicrobiaceae bacterium]|nr:domain containing rane protein [Verrucomicrobiaceae bacterium]